MTMSILVIDDDEWMAASMMRHIERSGRKVLYAANAIEGMDMVDEYRPAVIIMDIFMPGPNGIVLLHEIASHSDIAHIPIIVCTNSARDVSLDILTAYGVRAVVDKTTMLPDDIMLAVERVLAS